MLHTPVIPRRGTAVEGHPQLHEESEASLGYMRTCLTINDNDDDDDDKLMLTKICLYLRYKLCSFFRKWSM